MLVKWSDCDRFDRNWSSSATGSLTGREELARKLTCALGALSFTFSVHAICSPPWCQQQAPGKGKCLREEAGVHTTPTESATRHLPLPHGKRLWVWLSRQSQVFQHAIPCYHFCLLATTQGGQPYQRSEWQLSGAKSQLAAKGMSGLVAEICEGFQQTWTWNTQSWLKEKFIHLTAKAMAVFYCFCPVFSLLKVSLFSCFLVYTTWGSVTHPSTRSIQQMNESYCTQLSPLSEMCQKALAHSCLKLFSRLVAHVSVFDDPSTHHTNSTRPTNESSSQCQITLSFPFFLNSLFHFMPRCSQRVLHSNAGSSTCGAL
jgi:hypothetical protein